MITYVLVGAGIALLGFLAGTINALAALKSADKEDDK